MSSIDQQIETIARENRIGLMSHMVVGYPSLDASKELVQVMAEAGADFIELQIPFTDPIADGPTIMKASTTALDNGIDPEQCFVVMQELSAVTDVPLLFMTYYNIVHSFGPEAFCQKAAAAGAAGLIVPDMPLMEEKFENFYSAARAEQMPIVSVLAPDNAPERLKEIAAHTDSILYLPSRTGVTGAGSELAQHLKGEVDKIRAATDQPIAIGFGVSSGAHVSAIKQAGATIAVVGSAVIDRLDADGINGVRDFFQELTSACRG